MRTPHKRALPVHHYDPRERENAGPLLGALLVA